MKIRTGDTVVIIAGKDKGKTGKVVKSFPRENRVIVDGVNLLTKHQRPRQQNQKGQIVKKSAPIHVSNAMLVDPKEKTRTRVAYEIKVGNKVRVAKKSGTKLAS